MARYEELTVTELVVEKIGMNGATPVGQAAHIADAGATYTATEQGIINSILVVLENLGFTATS